VITGAARGIGEFTSRVFHAEGANILLVDHPTMTTQLKQLYEELGGAQNHKVHMLSLDVTDPNAPLGLESYIRSVFPGYGLDVMVHNAGITRDKTFANMKLENFQSVINVNINAIAKIDEVLLKSNEIGESVSNSVMRHGGKIVCLSSISGIAGGFGQSNYSCTKAAVMGYVSSQAHLLAARGITVNAIAPGFIETEMTKAVPYFTRNVGRIISALQQPGYPVDIAEAILFLSSDASSGMSGTTIRVCGLNLVGA
jgi:3-oxoacyl-[acyl-carrier protein] reductase